MDSVTLQKGHALLMILMDNASSPTMLFQIIRTCSMAKHAFDKWPNYYLKTLVSNLPRDLCQLETAYIAARDHILNRDGEVPFVNTLPDLLLNDGETYYNFAGGDLTVSNHKLGCSKRQSQYLNFVGRFLGDEAQASLPERLATPREILRKITSVHEAVETLLEGSFWQSARTTSGEHMSASEKRIIRRSLWRFHLFCVLFQEWEDDSYNVGGRYTNECDQRRFMHAIGIEGTQQLVCVYDDLLWMLQSIHTSHLAAIFQQIFIDETEMDLKYAMYGHRLGQENQAHAVEPTERILNSFLNWRLSKGLPFIAKYYRTGLPDVCPFDIVEWHDHSTADFLTRAITNHFCPGFQWPENVHKHPGNGSYELHPVYDGRARREMGGCTTDEVLASMAALGDPSQVCDGHDILQQHTSSPPHTFIRGMMLTQNSTQEYKRVPAWNLEITFGGDGIAIRKRHFYIEKPILRCSAVDGVLTDKHGWPCLLTPELVMVSYRGGIPRTEKAELEDVKTSVRCLAVGSGRARRG